MSYKKDDWDEYANLFAAVQTNVQSQLQNEAVKHLTGSVADFGCGPAKLAALLYERKDVDSYAGIDANPSMVRLANDLLTEYSREGFNVREAKIEDVEDGGFSSGVCLNSYYTWPDTTKVLKHIYSLLRDSSTFILATPNEKFDPEKLDNEEKKEHVFDVNYKRFRELNYKLIDNPSVKFIPMDNLIGEVRSVGFKIKECHQSFYHGGMNFLVLFKSLN